MNASIELTPGRGHIARLMSIWRSAGWPNRDAIELDLHLLDLLRPLFVGFEDRPRVEPLTLGAGDLVTGGVLIALQPFDLRNEAAAMRFEGGELFQLVRQIDTARRQSCTDGLDVFAYISRIKHENLLPQGAWHHQIAETASLG